MLDHFSHLFRFVAIAEEGSMHKAAARLNLTQPALSRSIGILEASFGRALLERHARGVRLTPFGERVLKTVRRLGRQWDIAQSELRTDSEQVAFRLGVGPFWRTGLLAPVFDAMRTRHPNLLIEVSPLRDGHTMSDLNEGRLDATLGGARVDPREHPNLVWHKLTEINVQITARKGHPVFDHLATQGTGGEGCLLDYPWIAYTEFAVFFDDADFSMLNRLGREPEVWMKSANLMTVLTTLQNSDSLCVLWDLLIDAFSEPSLMPVPIDLRRKKLPLGLTHRTELSDWPVMRDFLTLSQARLAELTGAVSG